MLDLARQLWEARRTGSTLDRAGLVVPASSEEAYAVQAEVARLSGFATAGFKVGSTSIEAQRALGTTEPGSAPLLAPHVLTSRARLAVVPAYAPAVEGEIAFRLGADLPPRPAPYSHDEVAAAIAAAAGAIEVVGSRIAGGLSGIGRFLSTADGGLNIALAVGRWTSDWRPIDLKALPVSMQINGTLRGQGVGARALGDPLNVMVWLANQQSARGRGLKRGEIVSTGTCTGLDAVRSGDRAVGQFGPLGEVEIGFESVL